MCEAGEALRKAEDDSRSVDMDSLRENLITALEMDEPLGTTAKAIDVALSHERIMGDTKILTDIRPLFQSDPSQKPTAATIVHTLSVKFYEHGTPKEMYFALDSQDVQHLISTLERASTKEATLRAVLDGTGITCLQFGAADDADD